MSFPSFHYIYLDRDSSETVLQDTTDPTVSVGSNKILVCIAWPVHVDADCHAGCHAYGGGLGYGINITADNIVAGTVTSNEIAANTITAGNIAAGAIETDELAANAVIAAKIAANTITADKLNIGSPLIFNEADGLFLLNDHCEISPTVWTTLRRQAATLSGAFHQVQGRWLGTRALIIEEQTTNLVTNPSFELGEAGWTYNASVAAHAISTEQARVGDYSDKITMQVGANKSFYSNAVGVSAGVTWSASAWVYLTAGNLRIELYEVGTGALGVSDYATELGRWIRVTVTATDTNNAGNIYVLFSSSDGATVVYVDAVQCEGKPYPTSYCDGTLGTGYAWNGATHASTSVRTQTLCNLDAHIALVSNHNTLSFRVVAQMAYDSDADWPDNALFWGMKGADDNNRIRLTYEDADLKWKVYINGGIRVVSSAQSFSRGDWMDVVITLDFATDEYIVYVNGVEDGTDDTVLSAPVLTDWHLGSIFAGGQQANATYAEYAVFDNVLTAIEVAQMYNLQRPLVDGDPFEGPGIYIVDGRFKIASSTTGNRIEIDADEIAGYDSAGVKQFWVQASDGAGYFGGGECRLNEDGMQLIESSFASSHITWRKNTFAGQTLGEVYDDWGGGAADDNHLWLRSYEPIDGGDAKVSILAVPTVGGVAAAPSITLDSSGLIYVEFATFQVQGPLETTQTLKTLSDIAWNFGDVNAGATGAADRKIFVQIAGNWYTIKAINGLV